MSDDEKSMLYKGIALGAAAGGIVGMAIGSHTKKKHRKIKASEFLNNGYADIMIADIESVLEDVGYRTPCGEEFKSFCGTTYDDIEDAIMDALQFSEVFDE